MKKLTTLIPILALFSACSSAFNTAGEGDFGCPGMPMGVVCKTPAAVYRASMGEIPPTDFDGAGKNSKDPGSKSSKNSEKEPQVVIETVSPSISPSVARPIREPAQVMRIWYAPWIDKNDGFNGASYKFVEVATRKWSYGRPESAMGGVVIPYKDGGPASQTTNLGSSPSPSSGSITSPQQPPNQQRLPPVAPPTQAAQQVQSTQLQRNKQQAISQGMPNALPNFDLSSGAGLSVPNVPNSNAN